MVNYMAIIVEQTSLRRRMAVPRLFSTCIQNYSFQVFLNKKGAQKLSSKLHKIPQAHLRAIRKLIYNAAFENIKGTQLKKKINVQLH